MSATERHMLSDQKGLEKQMNVDPHQNTYTWNSKHNEKRLQVTEREGNRRSHARDGNQKSSDFWSISLEVRRQLCMLFKSEGEKRYQLELYTKPNHRQCGLVIILFLRERSPKIYLPWALYQGTARGCTLAIQGNKQKMRMTQDLQNQGSDQGESPGRNEEVIPQ